MLRTLFVFTAGAATGAYATLRVQQRARRLDPENVGRTVGRQAADRGADVARQVLSFLGGAAEGAQQRTTELLDEHNAAEARRDH